MKRIEAAKRIHALYNSMEVRKVKLSTIYRHIVRIDNDFYKYYGVGYDYTGSVYGYIKKLQGGKFPPL